METNRKSLVLTFRELTISLECFIRVLSEGRQSLNKGRNKSIEHIDLFLLSSKNVFWGDDYGQIHLEISRPEGMQ